MIKLRAIALILAVSLLLVGCANFRKDDSELSEPTVSAEPNETESGAVVDTEPSTDIHRINPLPDTTMESLMDGIFAVALEKDDIYMDDTGVLRMNLKIYSYDQYDMVDIAKLTVGDIFVSYSGEVEVTSVARGETGRVYINGGLEGEGFELVTDDSGIFYERGYNDALNWYEVGESTLEISADFLFTDNADLEQGEKIFNAENFIRGDILNYDFTPYNTTIRIENGLIIEMNRRYSP